MPTGAGLACATSPARLREMNVPQLGALAEEIRGFLVASVAETGGHLGSNLGIVELTIALHRVFDSPVDAIVWDTGHQAYVHKLLTGRQGGFASLRQRGGLSGYPSRAESAHDLVENSHASTALSYAHGLAVAGKLRQHHRHVVAVVGDGALTGGLAYEALNNIGVSGAAVTVVLNDNGRSYAPTITSLSLATGSLPHGKAPAGGDMPREEAPDPAQSRVGDFFRALGLSYVGPVDGHDIESLEEVLAGARRIPGPVVVHVITKKGLGYEPAERDEEKCLHDVGRFDVETGKPLATGARLSYTEAFASAVVREAASRPDLVAITAAMPGPTGLIPFRERFPDRFFDVGIAEQHAVTAAAGMALGGLRPVVAIYSTFLNRAWDQILHDVGLHRLPVVFCLDRAGITGDDGPSHHGIFDLMLLSKVPGLTVLAPSCYEEVGNMLHHALEIAGPVAIRWPKSAARAGTQIGSGLRARRVHAGGKVCLLGVGKLVEACETAAADLLSHGIDATVWDVRCASPIDPAMIDDALGHRLVVTLEDGVVAGGVGSLIEAALRRAAPEGGLPAIRNLGVPLTYLPHGDAGGLLASLGLDGAGVSRAVLDAL